MLAITDAEKEAWLSPSRQLAIRVTMNGIVYDSETVTSLSFDSGSISGETYQIGSTYMNSVEIVFPSIIEELAEDVEVLPEIGILLNGEYAYTKLGTFYVTEFDRDRNTGRTTIKANDKMLYMEGTYESKLTYPAQYKDVALEIANLSGVEIDKASFSSLGTGSIQKMVGYTHRQAIGLIAQFEGGFASFNREGNLEIRRLRPTEFQIKEDNYLLKGFKKNENSYRIGGISVKTGEEETDVIRVGSTNGSQVELENKVMTQILLDQMWQLVKDLNYFPFELRWQGCPALEAGDWIYITDKDGTRYSVPNLSYSFTFNGGLVAESKATTNSSSQATYKYRGTLNQRVDTVESILGSNNWNTNYYDQTEPSNPKEGDTWFKPNGKDKEIWVYKNVDGKLDWVLEISSAPNTELVEAIDQAVADSAQATQDANDAVEKANQAVAEAGFANNAAQTAVEQSANAVSQASNASIAAQEAKQNSANAVEQAQQALTNANNLMNTVDDMQGTITSISTVVDEVNNQLAVKVNQTDFDKLAGTVSSQGTAITANANAIALKADSSTVNTIKGTVESLQSELSVQAGQIKGLVSKTDGLTTDLAQLSLKADGLDVTVSQVKSNLENQVIGGRNYFQINQWEKKPPLVSSNVPYMDIQLEPNTEYTLSTNIYRADGMYDVFFFKDSDVASFASNGVNKGKPRTLKTSATGNVKVAMRDHRLDTDEYWIMLSKGNVALDWTPAPEDLTTITEFSNFQQTVEGFRMSVESDLTGVKAEQILLSNQYTSVIGSIADLINRFPDPLFKNKAPQPVLEGSGMTINYDANGVVINNASATRQRFYWNSILTIGKTYDIKFRSNGESNFEMEVGTSSGDNAKFQMSTTNQWYTATIKATVYAGFSFWIPSNCAVRLSELYVYESGTGVTTAKFASLEQTVSGFQTTVNNSISGLQSQQTQLAGQITSSVSDLNSKISSQYTQLTNQINLRVQKGDVINQINVDTTGVLIAGQKVHITGQTTIDNAVIKNAMIADAAINDAKIQNASISSAKIISLDANKISTGSLIGINIKSASNGSLFEVQGNNLRMTKANGDNLIMDTSGIYWKNTAGDVLFQTSNKLTTSDIFGTAEYNAYLASFNETRSVTYATALAGSGAIADYSYIPHRANGYYGNFLENNSGTSSSHLYLRPDGGAYVRVTSPGSTTSYRPIQAGAFFLNDSTSIGMDRGGSYVRVGHMSGSYESISIGSDGSSPRIGFKSVYNRTYSQSANACITSSNTLGRITSASKYKLNIAKISNAEDLGNRLLTIDPKRWNDKNETELIAESLSDGKVHSEDDLLLRQHYGLIAEDLRDAGLDAYISINQSTGEIEGIEYDRLWTVLIPIIRRHQEELAEQKAINLKLQNQITQLKGVA